MESYLDIAARELLVAFYVAINQSQPFSSPNTPFFITSDIDETFFRMPHWREVQEKALKRGWRINVKRLEKPTLGQLWKHNIKTCVVVEGIRVVTQQ